MPATPIRRHAELRALLEALLQEQPGGSSETPLGKV
jgi:hypothetical protein